MADHVDQAEHCGNSLGDDGGQCRAADSHAQYQNGEEIQRNVHEGRQQKKIDWSFAVAQASDDTCKYIIKICNRNSKENDKNIIISPLDDILRRVHPL